jgi:hypothetical protein
MGEQCIDGWEDCSHRHVVNVLAASRGNVIFLDSVATGYDRQTEMAQATALSSVLETNGGLRLYSAVVCDNTESCLVMREIIAQENPGLVPLQD